MFKTTIVFLISAMAFMSCEEMEDIHADYVKDGEIIYANVPDTVQTMPGRNRIQFKWLVYNGNNIQKSIVEWEDAGEMKSQSIDVSLNTPVDSVYVTIDNLDEKSYLFYAYNIDRDGNRSVKKQVTGSAYGDVYESSLTNRPVSMIEGGGTIDSVVVSWGIPGDGYIGTEVTYKNTAGELVTKMLLPEDDRMVIRGWKPEGEMDYRSFYIPEPNAIDTFTSQFESAILPNFIKFQSKKIDKTDWVIAEQNSAAGGYEADKAIDGDLQSVWHTDWSAGAPGYPHHFVVDMGKQAIVSKVVLYRRSGGDASMASKVEIQTSADNVTWVSQGSHTYDPAEASKEILIIARPVARYVKYIAVEGPSNFTALAELEIYGQEQVSNANWVVTDQNSFAGGYEADKAIDGDMGTNWHTDWSGGAPGYPHYFVVDMKQTVAIGAFVCVIRQGYTDGATLVRLETSMDGTNWVASESFTLNPTNNAPQGFVLSQSPEARYFKYVALEGGANFTHLAELSIIGEVK